MSDYAPLYILVVWAILCGCVTDPNARPTQGLNNSCALYALADAIEIQTRRPIPREERLRVWRTTRQTVHGTTLQEALAAAIKARWLPAGSYLLCVSSVNELARGPLVADLNGHAVTLLSTAEGRVVYLDPRYEDPASIEIANLDRLTRGFYWRIATPFKSANETPP